MTLLDLKQIFELFFFLKKLDRKLIYINEKKFELYVPFVTDMVKNQSQVKVQSGFYVLFNNLGHIGRDPQHYHMLGSSLPRSNSVYLDVKLANHFATK